MKASDSRKGTADAAEPVVSGVVTQLEAGNITKETDAADVAGTAASAKASNIVGRTNVAKTVTNQEVLLQ